MKKVSGACFKWLIGALFCNEQGFVFGRALGSKLKIQYPYYTALDHNIKESQ